MTSIKNFIGSTLGKKIMVAISGLLFCFFLLFHFANNLIILTGADNFNFLVSSLEKIKPLVRVLEALLLLILVTHITNTVFLTIKNKKEGNSSKSKTESKHSPFSSRTMFFSGSILFIFIVTHLSTFWYNFQITDDHSSYYRIVTDSQLGFGNIFITLLYLFAMIFLGFHIKHGFSSALITLGIKSTVLGKLINKTAFLFWLVIPSGFFMIAFWFGILNGGG
jgi:succinate dehydrogenase / fumarate reductase cytochrome b subunit